MWKELRQRPRHNGYKPSAVPAQDDLVGGLGVSTERNRMGQEKKWGADPESAGPHMVHF